MADLSAHYHSMALCKHAHALPPLTPPRKDLRMSIPMPSSPVLLSSTPNPRSSSYNISPVSEAVRLLVPSARFEASKLNVIRLDDDAKRSCSSVFPRAYILSHCDFTANLTLSISNVITLDQLGGWYRKDDVVAEWKMVNGVMCLHVHCFVSGPDLLSGLAAEFRYHVFSKELPLVLKAVLHAERALFQQNPGLGDAVVWVHFHSDSDTYNRLECWGPLRDAAEGIGEDQIVTYLAERRQGHLGKLASGRSMIQTLFAFLL
uniref:Staygreen protein domain-containing protein n=1 Tax=Kalanchoe fedtschenkoi TaxID=63787 RepID=A0A7N1A868_KALFE